MENTHLAAAARGLFHAATACLLAIAGSAWAQAPAPGAAAAKPQACSAAGPIDMPSGVNIDRIKLLDEGQHYKVYTAIEDTDEREGKKSMLPPGMAPYVDMSPSSMNRLFSDIILGSKRFKVFDMRPNVTAEHSDVLITAKVIDADQILKTGVLEGGRRVSESRVKLSVQVKNMYTGENLLPSDAFVEGKTGMVSGDRVVVTSAEDPNSADVRQKLAVDFKNAMFRAFSKANERIEELLRPMARVVSYEDCQIDLFGGSRMGMQPKDEMVVFRSQKRQLGETTILSNTRAVALVRCSGVGTENSQCTVIKSVAGYLPQDGDYAVVTDESLLKTRLTK